MFPNKIVETMIRATALALILFASHSALAENPLHPIAHFLRKAQGSSYSEAYVPMMAPSKLTVDHQALVRGLTMAKNCVGRIATFDTNEYAHFDNPLQLGFVQPPTLPFFSLRSKDQTPSKDQSDVHESEHSSGHSRFDFWIPL
jgi:hypothetical protein